MSAEPRLTGTGPPHEPGPLAGRLSMWKFHSAAPAAATQMTARVILKEGIVWGKGAVYATWADKRQTFFRICPFSQCRESGQHVHRALHLRQGQISCCFPGSMPSH